MILIIKKSQSKLYDISKHHSIHRCTKLYRNLGKLCYYEMKKNLAGDNGCNSSNHVSCNYDDFCWIHDNNATSQRTTYQHW